MAGSELDIQYVADLARLNLSDDERAKFAGQLKQVLEYVEQLEGVDVSEVEATAHANPVFNVMRPDVSRPGFGLEKALANAPKKAGGQFVVTKVIE